MYQKLNSEEEERWLLRAVEVVLPFFKAEILRDENARFVVGALAFPNLPDLKFLSTLAGSVFLHLAIESSLPQIRRSSITAIESLSASQPELVGLSMLSAISSYLSKTQIAPAKSTAANGEETETRANKENRLPALILACGAFGEECSQDAKERLLQEFVLVAHHPGFCT